MLETIPFYFWIVLAVACAAAGYIFYRRWRALRIDRRSASYLKAIGKVEKREPVAPIEAVEAEELPALSVSPTVAVAEAGPDLEHEDAEVLPAAKPVRPKIDLARSVKAIGEKLPRIKAPMPPKGGLSAVSKAIARKTTLPRIYERGLVMLYKPPGTIERGEKPLFLLPWAVAQARGSDVAPAFKALAVSEVRLVELSYAAILSGDRAFTALKTTVDATERAFLARIRPMAKDDARDLLEQLTGAGVRDRVNRLLKASALNQPVLVAPTRARRSFLQSGDIPHWLPAARVDRDLWHILVAGLDYSQEATFHAVKWIVQQPCDQATAALAMLRAGALAQAKHETTRGRYGMEVEAWEIARIVCERSEAGEYPTRDFDLQQAGEDNDQTAYPELLTEAAGEKALPWPSPAKLFAAPFDGRDAYCARFEFSDGVLYHRAEAA